MHVILLHNQGAGDESWSRKHLIKLVRSAGFKPHYHELDDALAQPSLLAGGEFVIVAGGDGSIRRAALKLLGQERVLAPLPLGTANNICRSLGLPDDPEDVVAGWKKPRRRAIDVGTATGPWGRRCFIEGVGLGLISRTIDVLEAIDDVSEVELESTEHRIDRAACVAAALAHELHPLEIECTIDGRALRREILVFEILNISRAGPALELAPRAKATDGRFDVVTVTQCERTTLLRIVRDRLAQKSRARRLPTHRARAIRFTPAADCAFRLDDRTLPLRAGETVDVALDGLTIDFLLPK